MKVTITLDIPEKSVYAGVVADALEKIAPYWDEGARGGDLAGDAGPISWDSAVTEEPVNPPLQGLLRLHCRAHLEFRSDCRECERENA